MFPITIHNQSEFRQLVRVVIEEFKHDDENEIIPFHQIRQDRGISQDTLTRWIKDYGIATHSLGKAKGAGKGIKRKDLRKLP